MDLTLQLFGEQQHQYIQHELQLWFQQKLFTVPQKFNLLLDIKCVVRRKVFTRTSEGA